MKIKHGHPLACLAIHLEVQRVFPPRAVEDAQRFYKRRYNDHRYRAFLQCVCACVPSSYQLECLNSCTDHTGRAFLQCACACVFFLQMSNCSAWIVALITIERLLSRMDPDVFFESTSLCAEATLRAAEKLFSWMTQQSACVSCLVFAKFAVCISSFFSSQRYLKLSDTRLKDNW